MNKISKQKVLDLIPEEELRIGCIVNGALKMVSFNDIRKAIIALK